ncbi:MAG: DUF1573 domain-containing protein [Bacteroidota bacterium]
MMLPLLVLVSSLFLTPTTKPELVEWVDPIQHDFGDVPYKESVQHVWSYRNISKDSISVDVVRPGCGCTTPVLDSLAIAPGETGKITIEFDAAKMGYFRQQIRVFFDAQRGPERLFITGNVVEK